MTTPYGAPMPAALPEAPLSINFKIPEIPGVPMLTVRGSNGVELSGLTEDVARHGAQIGHALTEFRAGILAGSGISASASQAPAPVAQAPQQQQQQQQTYQPQNPTAGYASPAPQQQYGAPAPDQQQYSVPAQQYGQPPQTGGQGPAPMCPHGQRTYKTGMSKTGSPYKMWACPAPQSDPSQCKPEWVK